MITMITSCVLRDMYARGRLLSTREESHKGKAKRASSFSSASRLSKCVLNSTEARYLDNYVFPISDINSVFVQKVANI